MKKIILAGMMALVASSASAYTLNKNPPYKSAKVVDAKVKKVNQACGMGAAVPFAGAIACGHMMVKFAHNKDVRKVVKTPLLDAIGGRGAGAAAMSFIPFVHTPIAIYASKQMRNISKDLAHNWKDLGASN